MQNNTFLSSSAVTSLIFLGFMGFFTTSFLHAARYNSLGQLIDDNGNIASDSYMPSYHTNSGIQEEYDDPAAMQQRLRQGYDPDLNIPPVHASSFAYNSRQSMIRDPFEGIPHTSFGSPDINPHSFGFQQQHNGLQPQEELLFAMEQGQLEDDVSSRRLVMPMPLEDRRHYFRTHAALPFNPALMPDPRSLQAQANFMDSQAHHMEQAGRKAQEKLMRRMVNGQGEQVAHLEAQLAQQSQQLQSLQAQGGGSGQPLQQQLREWHAKTTNLEQQLEQARSQGQAAALSAQQHRAAFLARSQEISDRDAELARLRSSFAHQASQPQGADPRKDALLAAQNAKIRELDAHIDALSAPQKQQPMPVAKGRAGEQLTYHQPTSVTTNFATEFAQQKISDKQSELRRASIIMEVTRLLGDRESTTNDFAKLFMRRHQQNGELQEHPVSGHFLTKYFDKFNDLDVLYQQNLADLRSQGSTIEKIKAAELEISQINKLRAALEQRRQQDLEDARLRFKRARERVAELKTDPSAPQAMRGTVLGNNRIAATGTSLKRRDDTFVGRNGRIITDQEIPYTRLDAAQEREAALKEQVDALEAVDYLTRKAGTYPQLKDAPGTQYQAKSVPRGSTHLSTIVRTPPARSTAVVRFAPGTKSHDGKAPYQRIPYLKRSSPQALVPRK